MTDVATAPTWPAHDPGTRRWLPDRRARSTPARRSSCSPAEWERFTATTGHPASTTRGPAGPCRWA